MTSRTRENYQPRCSIPDRGHFGHRDPIVVAAVGLWHLKMWAWMLALIVSGGYFHGMVLLLGRSVVKSQLSSMSFISVYFIAFTALLVSYLWRTRHLFHVSPADA